MIELLKLIFSVKGLQMVGFFWVISMALSLRYWIMYYEAFSFNLFQFASPIDLVDLCLSKFMYAATTLIAGGAFLAGAFLQIWANKERSATAVEGCLVLFGYLSLVIVPPFAIDRAATNDARLVHGGKKATLLSTIKKAPAVLIEVSNGRVVEGRWIGATSEYLFILNHDSSFVIIRRSEAKELKLH